MRVSWFVVLLFCGVELFGIKLEERHLVFIIIAYCFKISVNNWCLFIILILHLLYELFLNW